MELTKPHKHLIPALHAWLSENVTRIHILIIRNYPGVLLRDVPGKLIDAVVTTKEAGVISAKFEMLTLSIGYEATNKLKFDPEGISFQARFNGRVQEIFVPYLAIKTMSSPDLASSPGFSCPFEENELIYASERDAVGQSITLVQNTNASDNGNADGSAEQKRSQRPQAPYLKVVK